MLREADLYYDIRDVLPDITKTARSDGSHVLVPQLAKCEAMKLSPFDERLEVFLPCGLTLNREQCALAFRRSKERSRRQTRFVEDEFLDHHEAAVAETRPS